MDYHDDLKLPAEAIAQIAGKHHAARGVPRSDVHEVDSLAL
jgi:hypothetical protein